MTTKDVEALRQTAKGQEGRERLRTLTWIWNELNDRGGDPPFETKLAETVTLAETVKHGDLVAQGESMGMTDGIWWVVAATPYGHRCGYVRLPEGHPWQGLKYWDGTDGTRRDKVEEGPFAGAPDFDIEMEQIRDVLSVHGGISYAGETPVDGVPEGWWFGFDCAHSMDGLDPALNIIGFQKYFFDERAVPRTNAYVREQCQHLARQIGAIK